MATMAKTASLFEQHGVKATVVLDTYFRFAAERQAIFFRRFHGTPPPWTDDPILSNYKFTNAYRAADRVSQYLIRHVIYKGLQSVEEVFFRILLFKIFNDVGTWELLQRGVGDIRYDDFSVDSYDRVLQTAKQAGQRIYSGAYIMPSGKHAFGHSVKHKNHLLLIDRMMRERVPDRIADARSMGAAYDILCSYPTIGPFLGYQYVTDLNYSDIIRFSERSFVVPGPGARDGIRKCFSSLGKLSESELIGLIADAQQHCFDRLGLNFQSLWGRELQLIDCQNLFCEISKYARVAHPAILGVSGRTRIKQKFRPTSHAIDYWFPPHWQLNSRIKTARGACASQDATSAPTSAPASQTTQQLNLPFM